MKRITLVTMLACILAMSGSIFAQGRDVRREDRQTDKQGQQPNEPRHGKDDPANHDQNDDKGVDLVHKAMRLIEHLMGGHR